MPKRTLHFSTKGMARFYPQIPPGAIALGVVIRGMQTGALLRLADGSFVKANGDFQTALNRNQVEAAVKAAGHAELLRAAPAAVVVVKRRRILEQPPVHAETTPTAVT